MTEEKTETHIHAFKRIAIQDVNHAHNIEHLKCSCGATMSRPTKEEVGSNYKGLQQAED